ncbi:MAG TPA: hypothetical protein PKI11_14320 [Candidatus Hydrogenedentes bacterium]|nr:hypothetical protein [Candidatus Hydrogenedentota bacterium]HNT89087.1 hypothetical protein [Candidatus Hydrogenedentota bacterium]
MPYEGHVVNGVVVLGQPAPLEDGTRVRVEIVASPKTDSARKRIPLADRLASVIGKAEDLPEDWSENHDAYLREEHGK